VIAGALGVGLGAALGAASDARACGGCFHGPSQNPDVITDHRMIFRVSPQQTTLYDEIEYQGDPSSFAWVLPIKGPVTVGLSADIVFSALDTATQTSIQSPNLPPCQTCSCGDFGASGSSSGSSSGGGKSADAGAVTVISQQVVGPYESVQLQSTDPNALTDWLSANGFTVPSDVDPIIAAYVQEGFDFLALKLQPGQGVQAMRPVRVTTPGAGLTLPLRMVSAGTGPTVGITLWVVGDGRYEAANFPNFMIQASQLVWDWNTESSNYTTLVQQQETAANDATWQTESSLDLSPYQIEDPVLADQASDDYLPIAASDAGAGDDGGSVAGETADQVRQDDLATLFPGGTQGTVRITRMRADLSHAALATDLNLQASADQSDVSNFYQVTQSVNAPTCPPITSCPPCNGSSSGGVSSSGASGSGSSGGINEGAGGNTTTKTVSPGSSSFGCAASPEGGSGGWLEAGLAAFVGLAFARSRRRRPRR
jgi:MYXO-CTERM domain-containing protein